MVLQMLLAQPSRHSRARRAASRVAPLSPRNGTAVAPDRPLNSAGVAVARRPSCGAQKSRRIRARAAAVCSAKDRDSAATLAVAAPEGHRSLRLPVNTAGK